MCTLTGKNLPSWEQIISCYNGPFFSERVCCAAKSCFPTGAVIKSPDQLAHGRSRIKNFVHLRVIIILSWETILSKLSLLPF